VGPSQTHLVCKCRLGIVLEGVGRDGTTRAEVGGHVDVRPLSVGSDRAQVVEAEHLTRVLGLAMSGGRRRHLGCYGIDLQARGAGYRRRWELHVDRGALDYLVMQHILQLGIAGVAVQLVHQAVLVELVMHLAM
jgi:hypothetical protein